MRPMKKVLFFLLGFAVHSAFGYNSVMVADMDSGKIIYSENADEEHYPASLTKIMTLYLTFNALEQGRLRLDQNLIVSKTAAAASPVKIGLPAGSKITVENAIKAVTVYSANDMAIVLSENLTGDEGDFATMMTRVANEIGLENTHFSNASGLSDDDHVSTAKDMALLAIAIKKHYPQYWKFFSIPFFSYNGKSFRNGNGLLGSYNGCDGMKTGFTNRSKYSLVATAKQNGKHLVSIVLGAKSKSDRNNIARALLDLGFGKIKEFKIQNSHEDIVDDSDSDDSYAAINNNSKLSSGVQFGAFGTEKSAAFQQGKIYSILGINTYLEKHNGLIRVRARMDKTKAHKIKEKCENKGIDCFVF